MTALIVILVLVLVIILPNVKVVPQSMCYIIERLGSYYTT